MTNTSCNCEHAHHFPGDQEWDDPSWAWNDGTYHEYSTVPAGEKSARYVGPICDDCAVRCMSDYLI